MRINQQKNKIQMVTELNKLQQIVTCLIESPVLSNRKLGYEVMKAVEAMNERAEKK